VTEQWLELSARCVSLEQDLLASGPAHLRAEFFPETTSLAKPPPLTVAGGGPEADLETLSFLLRVLHWMEDVWLVADLERYWSHPANEGWMNHCHRWAATPSFRRWWPILGPLCGPGFREFAKERFRVGVVDAQARGQQERGIYAGSLELVLGTDRQAFYASHVWRQFSQRHPNVDPRDKTLLLYQLRLLDGRGLAWSPPLMVGFVLVKDATVAGRRQVTWRAEELFVPPALQGSGITARLLDALVALYQREPGSVAAVELRVQLDSQPAKAPGSGRGKPSGAARPLGPAVRHERVRLIEFYKSRGFAYTKPEEANQKVELAFLVPPAESKGGAGKA
jgi:GNAT superfamily N-acetyltransferase